MPGRRPQVAGDCENFDAICCGKAEGTECEAPRGRGIGSILGNYANAGCVPEGAGCPDAKITDAVWADYGLKVSDRYVHNLLNEAN